MWLLKSKSRKLKAFLKMIRLHVEFIVRSNHAWIDVIIKSCESAYRHVDNINNVIRQSSRFKSFPGVSRLFQSLKQRRSVTLNVKMDKFYGKKYKMVRCENLDEMLIEMG